MRLFKQHLVNRLYKKPSLKSVCHGRKNNPQEEPVSPCMRETDNHRCYTPVLKEQSYFKAFCNSLCLSDICTQANKSRHTHTKPFARCSHALSGCHGIMCPLLLSHLTWGEADIKSWPSFLISQRTAEDHNRVWGMI